MNYKKLSKKEEEHAKQIVESVYTIHRNLGPGLLEKIYSPRWIVVFYEMYFFNGVITIF
jgi:hypothetical protein